MSVIPSKVKAVWKKAGSKRPRPVTVDFETEGIDGRPTYPPKPAGISIKYPGKKARYFAFGHPTANNCTEKQARAATKAAWDYGKKHDGLLCQNGKFDVDVAEVHWGLKVPTWEQVHDTMFLLFLDDPHQKDLGLKPSAERLLGLPPDEQEAVRDWLVEHQPLLESQGTKISKAKNSEHYWGRYICLAPGDLVGEYANGDTVRTEQLFDLLYAKTAARKMLDAYDRERRLMPILLEMERQGLPVDLKRLKTDVATYSGWLTKVDAWIMRTLEVTKDSKGAEQVNGLWTINLNSGEELVAAMLESGNADESLLPLTKTGKYQTNKEALLLGVTNKVLLAMLKYRTQLRTCLNTFMTPWLTTALLSVGPEKLIYTNWNQVKAPKGDHSAGTRTGRLSSTPNFQNIPNVFAPIWDHDQTAAERAERKKEGKPPLPKCPFKLPSLPKVRSYIKAFIGEVMVDRDWSQQELRILAHFDGGELLKRYKENPWLDLHDYAREELAKAGRHYKRKPVKNTNLGLIYGMGVGALAERNDMPVDEASVLKKAVLNLYPGLKAMFADMRVRARANQPIRTWGGREYFCEPPQLVKGRMMSFDYKMVNVLIQGSAADACKEVLIRFHAVKKKTWRILLNVHDQLTVSAPRAEWKQCMAVLKECMEGVEFDIVMLSEGSTSTTNWAELKDYDKKGKLINQRAA